MVSEGSKLSVPIMAAGGTSCFCHIPTRFCGASLTSKQLVGRKRPRSSSDGTSPKDEMSTLMASEMNKLTFQEREIVYEEVHAIPARKDENQRGDEEMRKLIDQTREHITALRKNKQAYNRAAFLNPEYVDSDDFLSLFVIGEKFAPKNAAKKVVEHFAIKAELFAPHLLAKNITYEDLEEEDRKSLRAGSFQNLGKDKAGRTIILGSPCHEYKVVDNQIRAMWYFFLKMTEDPSVKKNGLVCVYFLSSALSNGDSHVDFYYKTSLVEKGVPFVVKGFHFCYDNEMVRPIMSAMQLAIGNNMRLRFRPHYGTTMEILYSLRAFGISEALFPIGTNGNSIKENFRDSLAAIVQREKESEAAQQKDRILCPTSADVLLGRGRHPQEHQGNLNLAKFVEDSIVIYLAIPKEEKKALHTSIVRIVQSQGGRFIKRGRRGAGWEVVDDSIAIDKVRNRFREAMSQHAKTKC